MGIRTIISEALRDLLRKKLLTEMATKIQRSGMFMKTER